MLNLSTILALLLSILPFVGSGQSFYLGKSQSFIIQEKGQDYKIQNQNGQTILEYKRVSQKGEIDFDLYYFSNNKCIKIVFSYPIWFIIFLGDDLSEKFKRLDQHHWIEKNAFIHEVSIINDDKFVYIVKNKDN